MTTTLSVELLNRLECTLKQFEQEISDMHIHRDQFKGWFDTDLFHVDAEHPLDYPRETRRYLQRLLRADEPAQREWLAEKISQQLTALHQALAMARRKGAPRR
ncbi:MAG TPA: primosomal replication protein PriC [Pseudidiomarina sp.]|nr:primosomal replication protein PriC [Pseudidiomarina sp.]